MRFKITEEILRLLKEATGERGAAARLCRESGLSPSRMSAILSGARDVLQEDTWLRLCDAVPALRALASPVQALSPGRQEPLRRATPLPAPPPGGGGFPVDRFLLRCVERLVEIDMDRETLRQVLAAIREEADSMR